MSIEQQIELAIEAAKPYYDDLPAVCVFHDLRNQTVLYMSKWGRDGLNMTNQELREMGYEYHKRFFNQEESKEYVPKILALLERNNNEEIISFFQQVRIAENGDWRLWLSSIKIFMRNEEGFPIVSLTVSIPVDAEHNFSAKVERLLDENNFLRHNTALYALLTQREKEILRLMALGKNSNEMASEFFISEDTIKTHRRNIKSKINAQNHYDVVRFAQAFNII